VENSKHPKRWLKLHFLIGLNQVVIDIFCGNREPPYGGIKGVAICTLKFGGKKHPWVDLKIKGGNREPPLKVGVDTFFYLQCTT